MRATCCHQPREMVPNGARRKDGSPILQCRQCVRTWHNKYTRKKQNYDVWFQQQAGLCAFCCLPLEANSNRTCLDHDHVTGRERGLVHAVCNHMVAGVENAARLIGWVAMRRYIEPN